MRQYRTLAAWVACAAFAPLQGCDSVESTAPEAEETPALQSTAEVPSLPDADGFVAVVDNPHYPLIPGTTFEYQAETEDGLETITVTVTGDTKTILGITATVVHDQVFLDGELVEDTHDWYAQDAQGNIWYLGEDSCEIVDEDCVSTEGSWEAGVDGAEAGIIMWADPDEHVGETYRQEHYQGVAEDMGKVLRVNAVVDVPYGSFSGCLETMDWSALEPGVREHKFYCPGTGLVLELGPSGGLTRTELVAITEP